jgi:hypothetical protein
MNAGAAVRSVQSGVVSEGSPAAAVLRQRSQISSTASVTRFAPATRAVDPSYIFFHDTHED